VERYLSFEIARFGEDRLALEIDVQSEMMDMLVPSFLIQPLVEDSVKHAMRAEGKLTIRITGFIEDDVMFIKVSDDGVGMSPETLATMMNKVSDTGLGIAVKNVSDRIHGYFGPESSMVVTSELGKGTVASFELHQTAVIGDDDDDLPDDELLK
jgi:two-component system sensor histidine kinase LytS